MTGRGAYEYPVTNSLITDSNAQDVVPSFGSNTDAMVIRNKEYIRDLYCPADGGAFMVVDEVPLNPGLINSFPWLSQIAANYEEYEFLQLAVTYKTIINDSVATNGQVGQVAIATNYNADQDAFGSKEEMIAYIGGMSAKTSQNMVHGVECDPTKNSGSAGKYVRSGFVEGGSKKDFDLGNTFFAVMNAPANYLGQQLGEIWISYTVQLRKPRITVSDNYLMPRIVATATTCPSLAPFGYINDGEMRLSTKATLPCEIRRPASMADLLPVSSPALFIDDLTADVPTPFNGPPGPIGPAPTGYQYVAVAFPAWFSGILEITLRIQWRSTLAPPLPILQCISQGQISRFYDIPWHRYSNGGAAPAWTHIVQNQFVGDPSNWLIQNVILDSVQSTVHFRVQPSLNGVENVIYFGAANFALPNPTSTYIAHLTVNGLNTALSVDDSAQNGVGKTKGGSRLLLENADNMGTPNLYP